MLTTALFERFESSKNAEKAGRSKMNWQQGIHASTILNKKFGQDDLELFSAAFQLARIVNHHQGFSMIDAASKQYQWSIDNKAVAGIWVNGCIIRSVLMEELAIYMEPGTAVLDLPYFKDFIDKHQNALAKLVAMAINNGLSVPALGAAIQFINGYFSEDSPMNIIQAQRDYFGAHKVVLKTDPQQNQVHIPWK
jgi:6-phosphogluconate dehydrogenase